MCSTFSHQQVGNHGHDNPIQDILNNYGSFSFIKKNSPKITTTPVWQKIEQVVQQQHISNALQRGYVDFIPQHVALKHGNPSVWVGETTEKLAERSFEAKVSLKIL